MPKFNLELSTEEIKTLQCHLERVCAGYRSLLEPHLRDVLTKVTLAQLDTEPTARKRAYVLDANHRPDENGPAF